MQVGNRSAAAAAMYEQGEVHRLRGEFATAEEAYRGASQQSAHAQGKVQLAEGDPQAALGSLRRAWEIWHAHDMPFHAARTRLSIGLACRVLSDQEGSRLELDAARALFQQLGAAPDVAHIDSMTVAASVDDAHGLTRRELQVLRLVAAGKTNKAIASELFLSQKTVDRHVSKIFVKLAVGSRAAAYAYEHKLI